jgi:hypothetical protein
MKMNRAKLIDFVERVGATFVVTFVSLASVTTLSDMTQLKAASIAAALSAGKFAAVQAQMFLNASSKS